MNRALEFLEKTNWEYKEVVNEQYNVKTCPVCYDSRFKFYISFDGLWDCKICSAKGNLYQLKNKLGGIEEITSIETLFSNKKELDIKILEDYERELSIDKVAYRYLTETRKFNPETIKHFRLGVDGDWIVIPHFQDEKLWNLKLRNYKQKEFKRVSGQPSLLFNIDNLNPKKTSLVIVEGETDCIAAWQLGIENVIGLTTGAGTFLPEWISSTLKYKEIYICLNSDRTGQKGAAGIAEKLGIEKCKNVILPVKDVNEYLINGGTSEEFYKILKEAKNFDVKNIQSLSDYVKDIDDWIVEDGMISGLSLPFVYVNQVLSGFKAEDLIVLSGDTGVGKTTISLNILHHFIKNNHRCLGFFLEGKIMYYIMRMMSMELGKVIDKSFPAQNPEEWKDVKERFSGYPLYFYSGPQSDLNPARLAELLKTVVKAYGIEFVFIDNLQKYIKGEKDIVQQTSNAVSSLKDLTVDLKIPILLITHIRKPEKDRKRVTMHDAKSSSTIYQDADVYLTLWNNKNLDDENDDMILTIEKNRMGLSGKELKMTFLKSCGIYREKVEINSSEDDSLRKRKKKTKTEDINEFNEESEGLI